MTVGPTLEEIRDRGVEEGQRRLDQSMLELAATGFIAGFTVVFGVVAIGIVDALLRPQFGETAHLVGALVFGTSIVFLVVGRAELFSENFLDPVVAAVSNGDSSSLGPLARLWGVTFLVNLAGSALMVAVLSVVGSLPSGTAPALDATAAEILARQPLTEFAAAVAGGVLVTLLSFLLLAADSVGSRITMAYAVGVFLALGPFDHVVVTLVHLFFGALLGRGMSLGPLLETTAIVTAGNVVGGIGIGVSTHLAQLRGVQESKG